MTHTRKLTITVVGLLFSVGLLLQTAAASFNGPAAVGSTLDRPLEPIIITNVAAFNGAPVGELCAYRYTGTDWEQIPFQIDEIDGSGAYVTTEDNIVDANDELVLMASDLGSLSPTPITSLPNIASPAFRVEVSNPLNESATGWAYLVRLTSGECNAGRDYVDFDSATLNLTSENYSAGWSNTINSFDRFTMFGSADILDRTKLFVRWGPAGMANEETGLLVQDVELVKDGAVRVIIRRGAALNFGYASLLVTRTPVPLNLLGLPSVPVHEVRVSFDLAPNVNGTYYNENVPDGVAIDGVPDTVPTALTKAWRQISLDDEDPAVEGTMVEVIDMGTIAGTRQHYYKDEIACGAGDTGDQQCWGDSGFSLISPQKQPFTVTGTRYILAGAQGNVGDTYYEYTTNPLTITLEEDVITVMDNIYLPQITK